MGYQTFGNRQESPDLNGDSLAQNGLDVLPVVPASWLHNAFDRVDPGDLERLRRFKIVPITWMPTKTTTIVVDEPGLAEANRMGLPVVGRIDIADFRRAFRYTFSKSLINQTTHHLRRLMPEASAACRITLAQAVWACFCALFLLALYPVMGGTQMLLMLGCLSGLFFSLVIGLRILCLLPHEAPPRSREIHRNDMILPVYTVLVPLFRETHVLKQLINALSALNYPTHLLDIKLVLEQTDTTMLHAVAALALPKHYDIIVVPAGFPQTKPRALNYAMKFARGSLVTIFDSEDIPEPTQLLKAVQRFSEVDDGVACLQARLRFFNRAENWLARQFSAEYATLFEVILPSLAAQGLPLLLGGTSNHFRVEYLKQVGGWDPFNVTEDADLGLRFSRMGYRTEALDSTTYEEANTDLRNWLKGFLQTWLVHNRHPVETARALGLGGFLTMQCMTLGVFASALLHPLLFASGVWSLLQIRTAHSQESTLSTILAGLDLFLLLAGYITAAIAMKFAMKRVRLSTWSRLAMTLPIYWCLLSIAAWQSVYDFIVAPFHWHKTEHGLTILDRSRKPGRCSKPEQPHRSIYSQGPG